METWLLYGIIASLFWGTYIIVSKFVTSDKYLGFDPGAALILMLIGFVIVFGSFYFYSGSPSLSANPTTLALGVLVGILWAAGMVVAILALKGGAEVARLTPIYNTNTLVAVTLGIILLGEVPAADDRLKVLLGALLIVIGGILVS